MKNQINGFFIVLQLTRHIELTRDQIVFGSLLISNVNLNKISSDLNVSIPYWQ